MARAQILRVNRTAALQAVTATEADDGPYFILRYPGDATREYRVLLGARLAPPTPGIRCVAVTVDSDVTFPCVSPETRLGPPYVEAVACTCPDWYGRCGLSVGPELLKGNSATEGNRRDAAAGCKHMMYCNETLQQAPVSHRQAPQADPAAAAAPAADACMVRGQLPGDVAKTREERRFRSKKEHVVTFTENDDDAF